jgi:hypothetical protein
MMRVLLAFSTAFGLAGGAVLAVEATRSAPPIEKASFFTEEAQITPKRLIIGLDISKSNPLIEDKAFAAKVGAKISDMIRGMGFQSEVHVRTFGTYDASSNSFYYDTVLSTRDRPNVVAAEIDRLIAGTPALVSRGRFHPQDMTNILGFLDNARESLGCSGMPTTFVLASDGIEDSEYAHLDDADSHLPSPDGKPFRGCVQLTILGVGQGTHSPRKTARLRDEWAHWAHAAGFAQYAGLNDW